jgi:hypothetical protein
MPQCIYPDPCILLLRNIISKGDASSVKRLQTRISVLEQGKKVPVYKMKGTGGVNYQNTPYELQYKGSFIVLH